MTRTGSLSLLSLNSLPRRRSLAGVALLALAAVASTQTAHADPNVPHCAAADRECGRQAFSQGTAFFDEGDYVQARAWFLAAREAGAHPVISFNLALCALRLGKPSLARAELAPLVGDPALPAALREQAQRELTAAQAALAHVHVESPEPRANTIEVDGQRVEAPEGELDMDPGVHRIRVSSAEVVVYDQEVQLEPGERLRLRVTNRARAIDVVVVPDPRPRPTRPETAKPSPKQHPGLSPVWFYASASVTVLLSAATVWSGLAVNRDYDRYRKDLPRLTPAQAESRVDDGHAGELRTNVLLSAAALSAIGTTLVGLLLVDWKPKPSSSATTLTLTPARAELRVAF